MINFVRKVVAGPKNRTVWEEYDLDLTYITDRLIAMAFPASGMQKTYRNSIDQVATYLHKKHRDNYLIINVSMRKYDYSKFSFKVKEYNWPDHQAPTLHTLFTICRDIYQFLSKSTDNVVAVHCNHGKGRTGSAIIAFIMYSHFYETTIQTLAFYNKRRFSTDTYGVDQPCQKRVLQFFQATINASYVPERLMAFSLKSCQLIGLQTNSYFLRISRTSTGQVVYKCVQFLDQQNKIPPLPLMSDIFIEVIQKKWKGDSQKIRINYNTCFLNQSQQNSNTFFVNFTEEEVKVNGDDRKFELRLCFEFFCLCHLIPYNQKTDINCKCYQTRLWEEAQWSEVRAAVQKSKAIDKLEACSLLFLSCMINQKPKKQVKQG